MVGNRSNLCFNRIFIIVLLIPAFAKTTTTYDVQFNDSLQGSGDDCYPSPLEDSSVTLSGVVTAVKSGTYKNFFLQDRTEGQWNGVYFYDYDNSVQPSRGDSITVTADSVAEYFGMTEIKRVTSYTIHSHNLSLPPPVEISTGTLAGGCSATGEAYEGGLVSARNVVRLCRYL